MGARKDELLQATIGYLLEHGVADLSLRPLAGAIGTSARLLIFHFKSKERLLDEVLREIQARLRALNIAPSSGYLEQDARSPMSHFWEQATAGDWLPYWRLLYEVHFIALQNPDAFASYLAENPISWASIIEARLPPTIRSPAMVTLVGAVFDGLMIELLTNKDAGRAAQALDLFIGMLRSTDAAADTRGSPHVQARSRTPRSGADRSDKNRARRRGGR